MARLLIALVPWFVVVWAAASPRLFDMPDIPERKLMAEAGDNLTLDCPGVTDMSLVMQLEWWANEMKLVHYVDAGTTVWENRGRITLRKDNYALQIYPVSSEDNGRYKCLVNSRPRPEAYIVLQVLDVPDPPGRPLIMGFTSRKVNLSWAPPPSNHNAPIIHYLIHIRKGEKGLWDIRNGIQTPDNRTHHEIAGLLPFSVYSFRVISVNKMGRSVPSIESYYIITLREGEDWPPQVYQV